MDVASTISCPGNVMSFGSWGRKALRFGLAKIILVAAMLVVVSGCAGNKPTVRYVRHAPRDIIFNPGFRFASAVAQIREPWPVTAAYDISDEVIEFEEFIIDLQGNFGRSPDRMYRRFESRRYGRGRR